MRVIGVIRPTVAAQIGDSDYEAIRAEHLRIETAHAECFRVEGSGR